MNGLNMIPIFGWLLASFISFLVSIPIYFLWNFLELPFFHVVGLVWLIFNISVIIFPSRSIECRKNEK